MHPSIHTFIALVSLSLAAGCHHHTPAPVTTTSATLDARAVIARGGEFYFVLDESPSILANIQQRCATQADAAACVDRIRQAGAREGWRIVPIDADHARLQSFGSEAGEEEIFLEAPVAIESATGSLVKVRPTAALMGTRLPPADKVAAGLTIEVIDTNTLGFEDGARGRLLFRRK